MANDYEKKATKVDVTHRVDAFCRILIEGGKRSDCIKYAKDKWGIAESTADQYLRRANEALQANFEMDKPKFRAQILNQVASLQQKARESNNLAVALGCINTAAKIARII